MNKQLLKSKMALYSITDSKMASILNMSKSAFSRRISGAKQFSILEIKAIKETLHLKDKEVNLIFLG